MDEGIVYRYRLHESNKSMQANRVARRKTKRLWNAPADKPRKGRKKQEVCTRAEYPL